MTLLRFKAHLKRQIWLEMVPCLKIYTNRIITCKTANNRRNLFQDLAEARRSLCKKQTKLALKVNGNRDKRQGT